MLAADKIKHLKAGSVVALGFGALVALAAAGWYGTAIAGGSTLGMIAVEWYQKAHDKGTPEWADVVAGSLPAWILGALVGWLA